MGDNRPSENTINSDIQISKFTSIRNTEFGSRGAGYLVRIHAIVLSTARFAIFCCNRIRHWADFWSEERTMNDTFSHA